MSSPADVADTTVDDPADRPRPQKPAFESVDEWVEMWFAHAVNGPYMKAASPGGRTWCAQWWDHPPVVLALHALWSAWEAARIAKDPAAMSAWWVHHAHPHIRWICDAEHGPMYRCTPNDHIKGRALTVTPAPLGWFEPDPDSDS